MAETQNRETPPDGDFASYLIKRDGNHSPGEVREAIQPTPSRPSFDATPWFIALATATVFGGLGLLALSESVVTIGSKRGPQFFEGLSAVGVGFALLAIALFAVWRLASSRRIAAILGAVLLGIWLTSVGVFFTLLY